MYPLFGKERMRITHAYCVELDDVVTIDEARRAYLSTDPTPARYTFTCTDTGCRENKAVVSGVNYTFNAEDFPKRVEAHFRAISPEKHLATCEWRLASNADAADTPVEGESPEDVLERTAKRKLTDRITDFNPDRQAPRPDDDGEHLEGEEVRPVRPRADRPRPLDPDRVNPRTRTQDLERLVHSYREARAELSEAELRSLHINVAGVGRIRLIEYFRPLQYCDERTINRIINGGAHFDRDYGQGFRLKMIDRIKGLPVFLYVGADMMESYRYRKYVRDIVNRIPAHRNVRVYVNGVLRLAPNGKSWSLQLDHLRHLALVLGAKVEPAAAAPATEQPA